MTFRESSGDAELLVLLVLVALIIAIVLARGAA